MYRVLIYKALDDVSLLHSAAVSQWLSWLVLSLGS